MRVTVTANQFKNQSRVSVFSDCAIFCGFIKYLIGFALTVSLLACNSDGGGTETPTPNSSGYTVSGTVSGLSGTGLVLQNNGADNKLIGADGAFAFNTPLAGGANYAVTVLVQPKMPLQTCSVTRGTGTVSGANISDVTVSCAASGAAVSPSFAYVANSASNDVSGYAIDARIGALTPIDCGGGAGCGKNPPDPDKFIAGWGPNTVTVDPSNRFAYVSNSDSGDVSAYAINASTGALTLIDCGGGPGCSTTTPQFFAAAQDASSVSVDPSGQFVFVTHAVPGEVSAYALNARTGALTFIDCGGGPECSVVKPRFFAAGWGAWSVAIDPSGQFAYVVNYLSSDVSAYTINARTGALRPIDCGGGLGCSSYHPQFFATGSYPASVTVDPRGKFAYVANGGSNDVSAYAINASTGALTSIDCGGGPGCSTTTPKLFVAGTSPHSITLDPSGKFAYVANSASNDVSAYAINASTGALTLIDCGGVPWLCSTNTPKFFLTGTNPQSITVDPSGQFAYVANGGVVLGGPSDVSAYTIDASTGRLKSIDCRAVTGCSNQTRFAAGRYPQFVTTTR
jgi:6-phosphogluconolactonase